MADSKSDIDERWQQAREHAGAASRLARAAERMATSKDPQAAAVAAASQAHGTAAIAIAMVTPAIEGPS